LMSETESLVTKVVILVDQPSGIRNKESTRGLEKLEGWPFNGGRADIYIYWDLRAGTKPISREPSRLISVAMRHSLNRLHTFCAFSKGTGSRKSPSGSIAHVRVNNSRG
jgi:hypothetical protein